MCATVCNGIGLDERIEVCAVLWQGVVSGWRDRGVRV